MNRKEQLEKIIDDAREELSEIVDKENLENNRSLVGKCFKYLNRYGGYDTTWWIYRKVLGIDSEGFLTRIEFQTDCNGKITIEKESEFTMWSSNWTEIHQREFDEARIELMDRIVKLY